MEDWVGGKGRHQCYWLQELHPLKQVTMRAQSSLRCVSRAPAGWAGVPGVQQNFKHHQVEEVLQRQALSKSSLGRSLENMVIIRPLRLQED